MNIRNTITVLIKKTGLAHWISLLVLLSMLVPAIIFWQRLPFFILLVPLMIIITRAAYRLFRVRDVEDRTTYGISRYLFGGWVTLSFDARRVTRIMFIATVTYLALPYFLFLLTWLKPVYGIISTGVLAAAVWLALKSWGESKDSIPEKEEINILTLILVLTLVLEWLSLSGIGAIVAQNNDYYKHNAIFQDLTLLDWPIWYDMHGGARPLVYYTGYYLPITFLAGITSPALLDSLALLSSTVCVLLAVFWFYRILGRYTLIGIIVFIFYGGLDLIGNGLAYGQSVIKNSIDHIEWWSKLWNYCSQTALLYWAPHHAAAVWLCTGVLVYAVINKVMKKSIFFIAALSVLWSPFVTLGLAPLCLSVAIVRVPGRFREYLSFQNLAFPLLMAVIFGLYFFAGSRLPGVANGFIWVVKGPKRVWLAMAVFLFLKFGIYLFFVDIRRNMLVLFVPALITLFLLPLVTVGFWNDFTMRTGMPSIYIITILVAMFLSSNKEGDGLRRRIVWMLLMVASFTMLTESLRGLLRARGPSRCSLEVTSLDYYAHTQYLGNPDSFFFKYLVGDKKISDSAEFLYSEFELEEVSLHFDGQVLGLKPGIRSSVTNGHMTLINPYNADTHFVCTNDLNLQGIYAVTFQARGENMYSEAPGHTAGMVSLIGNYAMARVPEGTIDWTEITRFFTVRVPTKGKIGVGLGGWTTARGRLEVKDLKLYKILGKK